MTAKKTTMMTHPDSDLSVETDNPAIYLDQGWVEAEPKK